MTKDEILNKVADLIGIKFSTPKSQKFNEVELEGGYIITNQKPDTDFVVGDIIYLVNDDQTYSIVGAGTWKFLDGEKIFETDTEGKLVSITSGEEAANPMAIAEEGNDAAETMEDETEDKDNRIVDAIIEALLPMVEEMKNLKEEMGNLKKDYMSFKQSGTHSPLKDDKIVSNAFNSDERYEVFKALKEAKRRK
jgi:uncharacterized protein YktA (UPF0223 family)